MVGKPRQYPVVRAHKSHSQKIEFDQKLVPSSHWMIPSSPSRTRPCTIRCIILPSRHPVCCIIPSSRWTCCLTIRRIKCVVPLSRPSFWHPTVILAVPFKPTLITNSRMSKSLTNAKKQRVPNSIDCFNELLRLKDKIITKQALEIAELKQKLLRAKESC